MQQIFSFDFATWVARLILAQSVTLSLMFLNIISYSFPHSGEFKPFFLLMAVYYWAIYRPTVMPLAYTFVLGLILDLQTGLPVGITALILILIQSVVQRSRLFLMGQSYAMVWLGFFFVVFSYALALWATVSFFLMHMFPITPILVAAGLSVLIFPFVSLLLQAVHKILPMSSKPLHSARS